MTCSVAAVIVTYRPALDRLRQVLVALRPQVAALIVVDNSADSYFSHQIGNLCVEFGAQLRTSSTNIGLAAALNDGLRAARAAGFSHALLMDQDSLPANDMVDCLVQTLQREAGGTEVAAVGAAFSDERGATPPPFVRVGFPLNRVSHPTPGSATAECDFLISSGCLVPLAVVEVVGEMDEQLFIDNVDLDWSFRARARGMRLLGEASARLAHELGDSRRRMPWGRHVIVHSPVRLYYIMRNRVLLYRRRYVPLKWKAQDALRVPWKLLLFSVFIGPRVENVRHMLRGLLHGLLGRAGPLEDRAPKSSG